MIKPVKLSTALKLNFDKSIEADKVQLSRIISLLAAILISTAQMIDVWAMPSAPLELNIFRWIVVLSLIGTFIFSITHKSLFLAYYNKLKTIEFLLASFLIEYSIYLSNSSELAYYIYFSGLLIVFMILFSWTHLNIAHLTGITIGILSGYIVAILMRDEQGSHGAISFLFPTLFILSSSIIVGVIGKLVHDNQLYERFLLQQSLKSLYKEKQVEAERLAYFANHDALTGLPNRRFVEKKLNKVLANIREEKKTIVVIFIDLNGFKSINDTYGHDAGDEVLKVTSNRLKYCIRDSDWLVRLGGDEFLISLIIKNDECMMIGRTLNLIRKNIARPILYGSKELFVSASIGVAKSSKDGRQLDELITVADKRMYDDKISQKTESTVRKHYMSLV